MIIIWLAQFSYRISLINSALIFLNTFFMYDIDSDISKQSKVSKFCNSDRQMSWGYDQEVALRVWWQRNNGGRAGLFTPFDPPALSLAVGLRLNSWYFCSVFVGYSEVRWLWGSFIKLMGPDWNIIPSSWLVST